MFRLKSKISILFIFAAFVCPCVAHAQSRRKNDLKIEWRFDTKDGDDYDLFSAIVTLRRWRGGESKSSVRAIVKRGKL